MSPDATTGTSTSDTSSAVSAWSAVPVYICCAERGWSVSDARSRVDESRPDPRQSRDPSRRPRRSFTVTGMSTASAIAETIRAAPIRIVEQRRAGAGLRHLPHGAAEVEVDEVGACCFDHPRRLGHRAGFRAEQLDRERMLVGGDTEVSERSLVAVLDPGAADHLGADEACAEAASLPPERLHADARHRGEHEPRRDLDRPDRPGFAEVDHVREMVRTPARPALVRGGCGLAGRMATMRVRVARSAPRSRFWRLGGFSPEGRDPHPRGLRLPQAGARRAARRPSPRHRRADPRSPASSATSPRTPSTTTRRTSRRCSSTRSRSSRSGSHTRA